VCGGVCTRREHFLSRANLTIAKVAVPTQTIIIILCFRSLLMSNELSELSVIVLLLLLLYLLLTLDGCVIVSCQFFVVRLFCFLLRFDVYDRCSLLLRTEHVLHLGWLGPRTDCWMSYLQEIHSTLQYHVYQGTYSHTVLYCTVQYSIQYIQLFVRGF
jgi:hypothetical protein